MRVWIVLPAYNEEQNLPAVFDGFRKVARDTCNMDLRFVVVDDGSTDNTGVAAREAAKDLAVALLVNEKNQGLAAAFMRGMLRASECAEDDDFIVCMDADNTHLPELMPGMLDSIREGRDVVIASRYRPGANVLGVPLHRRLLSLCVSMLFRVVYPIPGVRDYSCGYRAYRASLLKKAIQHQGDGLFEREGFSCMVAILIRLHKEGALFGEAPMVVRYDQKVGASKMKIGSTIVRTLGVLVKERFSA